MNKHRLAVDEPASVRHMRNAPIKHFAIVEGIPFIWVEEEEGARTSRVSYRLFGTGDPVPEYYQHVASAVDPATGISAHLYKES